MVFLYNRLQKPGLGCLSQKESHQLHFWKTSTQVEVDVVVIGPTLFLAIEVKNASTLHPAYFRGLKLFLEDYPEASALVLYRGKHRYKEGKILYLPVEDFLLSIDPKETTLLGAL